MRKITLHLLFSLLFLAYFFLPAPIAAQDFFYDLQINNLYEQGRTVFSWTLPPEIRQELTNLDLSIDEQLFLTGLPNQEFNDSTGTLTIDNSSNQYQLILDLSLPTGEHSWSVTGYNDLGNQVFQTNPSNFLIQTNQSNLEAINFNPQFWENLSQTFITTTSNIMTVIIIVSAIFYTLYFFIYYFAYVFVKFSHSSSIKHQDNGVFRTSSSVGFIFDTNNDQGIPFARITFTSIAKHHRGAPLIQESLVSDVNGFYLALNLPPGSYQVSVSSPGFNFPSNKNKPELTDNNSFYQGETLSITATNQILHPYIPLDPQSSKINQRGALHRHWRNIFWRTFYQVERNQFFFTNLLLVISFIKLYTDPNWFFAINSLIYALVVIKNISQKLRPPALTGVIADEQGQPLLGVTVEVYDQEKNTFVGIVVTDKKGRFAFALRKGAYYLVLKKAGYINKNSILASDDNAYFTYNGRSIQKLFVLSPAPTLPESSLLKPNNP